MARVDSKVGHGWREGIDHTLQRMDLLTSVAEVLALGSRASMLKGDERWWMLPFYPFIPRFLWPSKPILDKGARFSLALGNPETTATAITYPGDLYLQFGLS